MKPLTLRERRLVAVALLLGFLCLLIFAIIKPLIAGFETRSRERTALIATLERNQRIITNMPALRKQAESQRKNANQYAILAVTRSEALDQFRETLLKMCQKNGVQVQNMQEISAEKDILRLRLDTQMSLTQLTATLNRLQQPKQAMLIDALSITADRAFSTGRLSLMDIRLEISIPYSASAPQ